MATFVSLFAAESITGLSRRTLRRRVADGVLHTETAQVDPGDAARVDVDEVIALAAMRLEPDDRALILEADKGVAEAQCDLALLLFALPGGAISARRQVAGAGCAPVLPRGDVLAGAFSCGRNGSGCERAPRGAGHAGRDRRGLRREPPRKRVRRRGRDWRRNPRFLRDQSAGANQAQVAPSIARRTLERRGDAAPLFGAVESTASCCPSRRLVL